MIEIACDDELLPSVPEGVELLREVTEAPAFTNQQLAGLPADDAARFVQTARARNPEGTHLRSIDAAVAVRAAHRMRR